jgi:hypothetical protein
MKDRKHLAARRALLKQRIRSLERQRRELEEAMARVRASLAQSARLRARIVPPMADSTMVGVVGRKVRA